MWHLHSNRATSERLLMENNPGSDLTINYLDTTAYVAHVHIFVPLMVPLDHIYTKVNKRSTEG